MTIILLASSVMAGLLIGISPSEQAQGNLSAYIAQLRSADPNVRSKASEMILRLKEPDRQQIVSEIESLAREFVGERERAGTAKSAIILLGDLQAQEAIPFLVDHLTFKVFYKQAKRLQTLDDLYPCAGALIKIGAPSIERLLERVEGASDEAVIRIAGFVIYRVLRGHAGARIGNRIEGQRDPVVRARLTRLQQYVRQFSNKDQAG